MNKELKEIKQNPVFEKLFGRWELMTLDCPSWCKDGFLSLKNIGSGEGDSFKKSYQCDNCGTIVEWYPFREQPDCRIYDKRKKRRTT